MKRKKILSFVLAGALLLAPSIARAATVEQVHDTAVKAYRLCAADAETYKKDCQYADDLNKVSEAAAEKPKSQQAAYIKEQVPNYTDIRSSVDKRYLAAVQKGAINSSGEATSGSSYNGADTCGDVKVSVDVGCSGTGNPIYDYLRGIIIFLGGAIGLAVVISIIVAGIQYSSSNGNPQNIAKAKDRIVNAVIGLVLYLFLAAILRFLIPQVFS